MGSVYSHWGEYLPDHLRGLVLSVEIVILSLAVGLPLSLLLAVGVMSRSPWTRWIAIIIVEFGRGVPALVTLYLVYDGAPQLGLSMSGIACAVAALGFCTGAYVSEIFRASLLAVDPGQREAAEAVGLTGWDTFRMIILPQAMRIATPALMGWAIMLFQGTSLCFAIAIPELMGRAYNTGSITFDYMGSLTLAGILYLAVVVPMSYVVLEVERRLAGGRRIALRDLFGLRRRTPIVQPI